MSFELTEPILIIGLGGVGSKLADHARKSLNSDCLRISHDQNDLTSENSIKISTKSVVNPSTHLIRGSTLEASDEIKKNIENYSTVILMSNLAGKAGAGIGPIVSRICKQEQKNLLIAQQSGNQSEMQNAIAQCISDCTFNQLSPQNLPMFDVEYLFVKNLNNSIVEQESFKDTAKSNAFFSSNFVI